MRIALGVALFALICCVGCGSSAPDRCQVLMDQAKERNQRYGDFVGNLGKQVKTLGAHAVAKAILQESFATRAWFLENAFGVKEADFAAIDDIASALPVRSLPEDVKGCSGSGLANLRGKAYLELNLVQSTIDEFKKFK
jgi:hypothetical protein